MVSFLAGGIEPPGFFDKALGRASAIYASIEPNDYLTHVPAITAVDVERIRSFAPKAESYVRKNLAQGHSSLTEDDHRQVH